MATRPTSTALILSVLGFTVLSSAPAIGQRGVPSLMAAAERSAMVFATTLAAHGATAGFVMPDSDRRVSVSSLPPPLGLAESAAMAANRFITLHADFSFEQRPGAFHFRHRDTPEVVDRMLRRPLRDLAWTRTTAMVTAIQLGRRMMDLAGPGGGVVGTGSPPEGCPISANVIFRALEAPAIDVLDSISRQAAGLVWVVSYGPGPNGGILVRLGLVCGNQRSYHFDVGEIIGT